MCAINLHVKSLRQKRQTDENNTIPRLTTDDSPRSTQILYSAFRVEKYPANVQLE